MPVKLGLGIVYPPDTGDPRVNSPETAMNCISDIAWEAIKTLGRPGQWITDDGPDIEGMLADLLEMHTTLTAMRLQFLAKWSPVVLQQIENNEPRIYRLDHQCGVESETDPRQ